MLHFFPFEHVKTDLFFGTFIWLKKKRKIIAFLFTFKWKKN